LTDTGTFKWAFVGDLQIPYHDPRAVELFFKVMKSWKPDAIDVVGDIDDQLEYSKFSDGHTSEFFSKLRAIEKEDEKALADYEKSLLKIQVDTEKNPDLIIEPPEKPERRDTNPLPFIKENADGARFFYTQLRKDHPNADIHASLGNHDVRVFDYIDRKAPEHIEAVTPNFLWGLDDLGITWRLYKEPPLERFAGIHVHHGASTTTTGLAVKQDIENYNISLVRGHDHRGGVVYKTFPMSKVSLVGMGTGHLCDPNSPGMEYTINPGWERGFGLAHVIGEKAHLQFVPIRHTELGLTCIVDGKVFVN